MMQKLPVCLWEEDGEALLVDERIRPSENDRSMLWDSVWENGP